MPKWQVLHVGTILKGSRNDFSCVARDPTHSSFGSHFCLLGRYMIELLADERSGVGYTPTPR